jgi:hypothetical protein
MSVRLKKGLPKSKAQFERDVKAQCEREFQERTGHTWVSARLDVYCAVQVCQAYTEDMEVAESLRQAMSKAAACLNVPGGDLQFRDFVTRQVLPALAELTELPVYTLEKATTPLRKLVLSLDVPEESLIPALQCCRGNSPEEFRAEIYRVIACIAILEDLHETYKHQHVQQTIGAVISDATEAVKKASSASGSKKHRIVSQ